MEKTTFKMKNETGEEIEYEVICTATSDDKMHNYICYTDNTKDKDNELKVYISSYEEKDDGIEIHPIETEEEWKWVTNKFNGITE